MFLKFRKEAVIIKPEFLIENFAVQNQLISGICTADTFESLRMVLNNKNHILNGFAEQDIEKRLNPCKTFPSAKSIVVLAMNYNKNLVPPSEFGLRGRFSIGAVGTDYHVTLIKKLNELAQLLHNNFSASSLAFTDTGPLVDRETALRTQMGYIGKNTSLHIPQKGSMFFLGYLLTDIKLNPTVTEITENCGSCKICLNRCPTKALSIEYPFRMNYCISYLTQKKGILERNEMKSIGQQLYGCDICQKVCPHNNDNLPPVSSSDAYPLIHELLSMSNKQFSDTIGKTAAGWRGKKYIQRNAVIVLGNTHHAESLLLLNNCLQDIRPLIRLTAVRSFYNLGFSKGVEYLTKAMHTETLLEIKKEMVETIQYLKNK